VETRENDYVQHLMCGVDTITQNQPDYSAIEDGLQNNTRLDQWFRVHINTSTLNHVTSKSCSHYLGFKIVKHIICTSMIQ